MASRCEGVTRVFCNHWSWAQFDGSGKHAGLGQQDTSMKRTFPNPSRARIHDSVRLRRPILTGARRPVLSARMKTRVCIGFMMPRARKIYSGA
jgi:hypothetical protein